MFIYIYAHLYYPHYEMYEHKQKYKGCAVHPKIWDAYLFNVANAYFKFWWKLGPTLYEYYYVNEDTTTYLSDQIKLQNNFAPMVAGISDQINKSINNQENIEAVIDNRTDMDSSSDINNKEDSNQAKVTFQQIEMLLDRLKQNDPAKYDEVKSSARTLKSLNIDQNAFDEKPKE